MRSGIKTFEGQISSIPHSLNEEHKYREMVENANDGFAISQDGVVQFVNQYLADLYGYSKEEIIGSSFMKVVAPEERQRIAEIHTKRMQGARAPLSYEMVGMRKDGTKIWLEHNGRMTTYNGRPALITIIRDISARKALEEERTALEARLQQAEKLQAIGQLAGGVAHDFNNQLMGIVGFAHLLQSALKGQPELESNVEGILVGAQRAADLTKQLLAFARKGKYVNERVDVHHAIAEVSALLKRSIDKRVRIEQRLCAKPSTVLGDPSQLQNAILNLAINARDSMPDGGEIIFTTGVIDLDEEYCRHHTHEIAPGRYLKISVTDSGIGIDEETQKHIFEPFFTTKDLGEGTGMGLASVYGTVKNHQGTVHVDSEVGRGTTIGVYLPVLEDEIEDEVEDGSSKETRPMPRQGHVFLIDDESVVCDVTSRMLRSVGHQVTACQDAHQAIEIYRSIHDSIVVVIIDMVMPQMDGRALFRALKEINPNIIALLASGYSLNGAAQQILDDGVKGFIQKPFGIKELSSRLADLLAVKNSTEDQA